jgi:hypothetical protein
MQMKINFGGHFEKIKDFENGLITFFLFWRDPSLGWY